MVQARTNGPMAELAEADLNITPAMLIDEFSRNEKNRLKTCSFKRRDFEIPAGTPEAVIKELRGLQREHQMYRKVVNGPVKRMTEMSTLSYGELLTRVRLNSSTNALGLLCRNFAHSVQSITVLFNDGSLGTFKCEKEGRPEQIEQPTWVDNFDVYKHRRPVKDGDNNSLKQRDQNRGRPYNPNYRRNNAWGGRTNPTVYHNN